MRRFITLWTFLVLLSELGYASFRCNGHLISKGDSLESLEECTYLSSNSSYYKFSTDSYGRLVKTKVSTVGFLPDNGLVTIITLVDGKVTEIRSLKRTELIKQSPFLRPKKLFGKSLVEVLIRLGKPSQQNREQVFNKASNLPMTQDRIIYRSGRDELTLIFLNEKLVRVGLSNY